jgi:hypothetical protein
VAPATLNKISPREAWLQADDLQIGYLEAGNGAPLIVFPAPADERFNALLQKLADSCRVISMDSAVGGGHPDKAAVKIAHALASLGIQSCSVMGTSAGVRPALALALAAGEQVDRLILLSPLLSESGDLGLSDVKPTTLVLVGTRDSSEAINASRLCREKIRSCHLSFVYGAGHGIADDRLDLCHDLISEFLKLGEQFIIFRDSQMIRP